MCVIEFVGGKSFRINILRDCLCNNHIIKTNICEKEHHQLIHFGVMQRYKRLRAHKLATVVIIKG